MPEATSPVKAVARVRELLDALGDALVSWRLQRVQSIEHELTEAVAALPAPGLPALDASTKRRLIGEVEGVVNALTRCRRLGSALGELARLEATALGQTEGYDEAGAPTRSGAGSLLSTKA